MIPALMCALFALTPLFAFAAPQGYVSNLTISYNSQGTGQTRNYTQDYFEVSMSMQSRDSGWSSNSVNVTACNPTYVGGIMISNNNIASARLYMTNLRTLYSVRLGRVGSGNRAFTFSTRNPAQPGFYANPVYMYSYPSGSYV